MNKVKITELPQLEQRLANSNMQLCSLIDFVSLSPADMELNRKTIQWPGRLPTIFEEHDQIVSEKTTQYQNSLKVDPHFCLRKPRTENDKAQKNGSSKIEFGQLFCASEFSNAQMGLFLICNELTNYLINLKIFFTR